MKKTTVKKVVAKKAAEKKPVARKESIETAVKGIPVRCSHTRLANIDDMKEYPSNPNKHSTEQISLLAEIIRNTGWRGAIVVSTLSGFIVRGHGRLAAAKKLGLTMVPVDDQSYESKEEEWLDLLADNKIAELSEMDDDLAGNLLKDLQNAEIDLTLTGYGESDLSDLLRVAGSSDSIIPKVVEESDTSNVRKKSAKGANVKIGRLATYLSDSLYDRLLLVLESRQRDEGIPIGDSFAMVVAHGMKSLGSSDG